MQRMEMALDEERGAKMHQKHDTVRVTNTRRERMENDGAREDRRRSAAFSFPQLFPITAFR